MGQPLNQATVSSQAIYQRQLIHGTGVMSRWGRVGIAITTYNRCSLLLLQIAAIKNYSVTSPIIVVCDDGSTDETVKEIQNLGIPLLGRKNKGIAWNKNRGLHFLSQIERCDVILLLDDDVIPYRYGWDAEWAAASRRFGHINFIPPAYAQFLYGGRMTADDPGISSMVGGMAIGQSAEALSYVGYMDVRFGRYGHEHSDFSYRFNRAGFGGLKYEHFGGTITLFYVIEGGIRVVPTVSTGTSEDLERNNKLLFELADDPIYRAPWRNDVEMAEFRDDVLSQDMCEFHLPHLGYNFSADAYYRKNPDVADADHDALKHYLHFGMGENRLSDTDNNSN